MIYMHIPLEKCPSTLLITSSGLAKAHISWVLGKYSQEGTSNGHVSYKNDGYNYLHFTPSGNWRVSKKYKMLTACFAKRLIIGALF